VGRFGDTVLVPEACRYHTVRQSVGSILPVGRGKRETLFVVIVMDTALKIRRSPGLVRCVAACFFHGHAHHSESVQGTQIADQVCDLDGVMEFGFYTLSSVCGIADYPQCIAAIVLEWTSFRKTETVTLRS